MDKVINNLKILLVCDNKAYTQNIKLRLEKFIEMPCYVWNCNSLIEATDMLDMNKLRADIIILDLGLIGTVNPINIYKKIGSSAQDIPIIVLTGSGEEEQDIITIVMEAGAADHMIRGQFTRLIDAIEFSLLRNKKKEVDIQDTVTQTKVNNNQFINRASKD